MKKVFEKLPNGSKDALSLALSHGKYSSFNVTPIIGVKSVTDLESLISAKNNIFSQDFYQEIYDEFFSE